LQLLSFFSTQLLPHFRVGSREDLLRRKREIERLIAEEDKRQGKFETTEKEMDTRYPTGKP